MMKNSMGLLNTDWIIYYYIIIWVSLVAQLVKKPLAMQDIPVWILDWEDFPGKGIGYPLQFSWAPQVVQMVKNLPATRETWVWYQVGKISWRRKQLPEGQYSGLENSMDRGAWYVTVHGVPKSWTWLNNFHFHIILYHNHTLDQHLSFFCLFPQEAIVSSLP